MKLKKINILINNNMKKDFKEIFDKSGVSRNYLQHNAYKDITIPKDVFEDMSDDEIENFIFQTIKEKNKELSEIKKTKQIDRQATPEEIEAGFAQIRKNLAMQESFKTFFLRK